MAGFVSGLVMRDTHFPRFSCWNAGLNLHIFQPVTKPIGVIPTISKQPVCLWQGRHQCTSTDVITHISCRQKQPDRATQCIRHSVQFGVQTAFRQPNQAAFTPFLRARLNAVRCALRWVASIISTSVFSPLRANSIRMRAKIPLRLQRTHLL